MFVKTTAIAYRQNLEAPSFLQKSGNCEKCAGQVSWGKKENETSPHSPTSCMLCNRGRVSDTGCLVRVIRPGFVII